MTHRTVDRERDETVGESVPEFMSEMVEDLEYIPRNERPGRASSLKRKSTAKWLLAMVVGALVLIVVLATAFDRKNPTREAAESLEAALVQIEDRLGALETKIALIEKSMTPGFLEKKAAQSKSKYQKEYHTVRSGDNLSAIAAKYGITVDKLCQLNQLTVDKPIKPDQKLLVSPN